MIRDNQLLVMERWRRDAKTGSMLHYFSIPGGKIEAGETPIAAVQRELGEETGMKAEISKEAGSIRMQNGRTHHFFIGSYISGEPHLPADSEEAQRRSSDNDFLPRWCSLDELTDDVFHPVYRQILPLVRELAAGNVPGEAWRINQNEL